MLAPDEIGFLTVYVILMVLISVGNAMVIITVCWKSDLKNSKNLHLLSLSCSDLLVGTLLIPNVITMRFSKMDWSKPWCLICLYMEHVAAAACMLTISAMAIDRFQVLAYPLKSKTHRREAVLGIIALVWVISFLYAIRIPMIYNVDTKIIKTGNKTITKFSCTVRDTSDTSHHYVTIVDFFILFFVPALILTTTNIIVSYKLTQSNVTATSKSGMDKRKKAIRLLLIMVLIFIVSHMPSFAARLHKTIFDKKMKNYKYIGMSFQVLSWSSSFINVLFYGSLNDEVKELGSQIRKILCKCYLCCSKKARVHPDQQTQSSSTNPKTTKTALTVPSPNTNVTVKDKKLKDENNKQADESDV